MLVMLDVLLLITGFCLISYVMYRITGFQKIEGLQFANKKAGLLFFILIALSGTLLILSAQRLGLSDVARRGLSTGIFATASFMIVVRRLFTPRPDMDINDEIPRMMWQLVVIVLLLISIVAGFLAP